MKRFLRGLLTVCLVGLLVVFGIVLTMKEVLVGTTEHIVKQELKKNVVTFVSQYEGQGSFSSDAIKKFEDQIENNQTIKKVINTYYDQIIDILSHNEVKVQIDLSQEMDSLIEDGEQLLKEYGIAITEEQKQELLSLVSSDTINAFVNDTITDIKTNLNDDTKAVIDSYTFVTSNTFKIMLCSFMLLAVVFLAVLTKSYYRWLSYFGVASIVSGVIVGILFPLLASVIESMIEEYGFVISMTSISTYGYVLIGLGILSCVISSIVTKRASKIAN